MLTLSLSHKLRKEENKCECARNDDDDECMLLCSEEEEEEESLSKQLVHSSRKVYLVNLIPVALKNTLQVN